MMPLSQHIWPQQSQQKKGSLKKNAISEEINFSNLNTIKRSSPLLSHLAAATRLWYFISGAYYLWMKPSMEGILRPCPAKQSFEAGLSSLLLKHLWKLMPARFLCSLLFFFVSFLHRYSFFRCQWIRAMGEYLHIVKAGFQSTTALWRLWFVRQICGTVHLQPIQNDNVGDCRLLYNNCSRREGRNERQVEKKDIAILPVAKSRPSKGLAGWCGIEKRPLTTGSEKLYYFCQESAIPALKLRCFGTISLESLSGLILDLFDGLLQLKYPINPRPNISWHHCCLTAEDPLENNQAT